MASPYHRLLSHDKDSLSRDDLEKELDDIVEANSTPPRRFTFRRLIELGTLLASLMINVFLVFFIYARPTAICQTHDVDPLWNIGGPLYSPAQSALRYERKTFDKVGIRGPYHNPPSDEKDALWESLYHVGVSWITKDEAALLPNWTEPLPGHEKDEHYLINLDVFHQLHCLNFIRKALNPERYGPAGLGPPLYKDDPTPFDHTDHCVNIIRENIMCNADITPNVWQWNEERQVIFPHFDTIRTCRNFDAIYDWAKEREVRDSWNSSVHLSLELAHGGMHGHGHGH
ncbi:hypothetical protein SISNIDRAFT_224893 [Sistotremastrum niveocremeum HHB9708]|uniref:Tat pathway signal sequence n=1 Tax=Sistotremastrum niveocremeum HHB9708 TaxID=1314777 RepID=A0A164QIF2_9AGAM|nr:hypothetical protein SISNIDRAFT_224893 [Sistotremastrum niveocremeum HHB9708]